MPLSSPIIKRCNKLATFVPSVVHCAVGWALSPPRCTACGKPLKREAVFCLPCSISISPLPTGAPLIDGATSSIAYAAYGGALAVALRRLKYEPRPELAPALGELLYAALVNQPPCHQVVDHQLLIPVPLHPQRLTERGFNQASLLARSLRKHLTLPIDTDSLSRNNPTSTQTQLRIRDRKHNVHHAFSVRRPERLKGKRVLIVDDVSTTGSTLAACSHALLEAGARSVSTIVVAQAQRLSPSASASLNVVQSSPRSLPGT